ncbi:SDR family NAD(P)-dependent oxidoreductase [Companilactobacillus kedongensis]|uniref:SDR family NAD(P)-dependent oxidoreductase n=1 Tax=Companilactobacillus kedongensis TaxID=2486004 RepID=UPI000F7B4A68|nr:SDR family NAD(P)-dependent oxidoreductase [Companilactobacillus kedongensis]
MTNKTWLITGVSSGFGRSLTTQLLAKGETVIGTVRNFAKVQDLIEQYPDTFISEKLDVTDVPAIHELVNKVASKHEIDVLVNNAGYGLFGAAEELSDEQVNKIIATDLTGSIQMIRSILPFMRKQEHGRIIQISSYGGQVAELIPAYDGPTHAFMKMLDPANGLAPGDPERMAARIIESADETPAPLHMVLGSEALKNTIERLETRVAEYKNETKLAASTDFPADEQ